MKPAAMPVMSVWTTEVNTVRYLSLSLC